MSIPPPPLESRIAGAVLGGAIGDAMGHPTEFLSMDMIREQYGERGVEGFVLFREDEGRRAAPYTDDTQMSEQVLRALLEGRAAGEDLDGTMVIMAGRFVDWLRNPQGGHRAMGAACRAGCIAVEEGAHWSVAGGAEAGGCGSVMRAYPFGLVFRDDVEQAEAWAVAHSAITHRAPIALAACAAMAVGIVRIVRGEPVEEVLNEMIKAAGRHCETTAAMIVRAVEEARAGTGPEVTLDRLRSWAAHEAIAAGAYLFARHPNDPAAAILEGANTPGDSDSIATLAGALCGARCGLEALPADWVRDVERSAELLELAREVTP